MSTPLTPAQRAALERVRDTGTPHVGGRHRRGGAVARMVDTLRSQDLIVWSIAGWKLTERGKAALASK